MTDEKQATIEKLALSFFQIKNAKKNWIED